MSLIADELADLLSEPRIGSLIRTALNGNYNHELIDGQWQYIRSPITTMEQLLALSRAELLRFPNLGKLSLKKLEEALKSRGLSLGRPPPPRWWYDALNEQT